MNKSIQQVKEFHEAFSHPIGDVNELEPLKIRQLRIKLLFEELVELAEASDCCRTLLDLSAMFSYDFMAKTVKDGPHISREEYEEQVEIVHDGLDLKDGNNVNQLEELDALCDLQYVLNGKILTSGLHEVFDHNFALVHQNNMSKLHNSLGHAEDTMMNDEGDVEDYEVHEVLEGKYILYNKSGKVIKPHDHKKVALTLTP